MEFTERSETELSVIRDVLIRTHRTVDVKKRSPFYLYNGRLFK